VYVEADLSDYFYDTTATSGDIAPDDQTGGIGFWRKVAVGGETPTSIMTKYESNADRNAFTNTLKAKLDSITEIFTTALKTNYDSAYTWISTNGAAVLAHISSAHAPSNAQKNSDITKAEIEAKLTGEITTHTHAGISGGGAKVYNVKDYGALGNGSTDDTVKIQDTINACFTAGGGVVYFPIGVYIIGGALQTSISGINYNSQLYIPQVNSNNSARTTISFLGEVQPNMVQTLGISVLVPPNSGVILRSTIQGSGTRPSVICGRGAAGNIVANFSSTNVSFKNLAIQITPNGSSKMTMGGINCEFSNVAMFENITCFPYNLNLVNSGKPDVIDIVGIAIPSINCELNNTIINCNVGGFTNGFLLGEHASVYNAVAICCVNGFNQTQNYHLGNYTKLSAFWCSVDFIVTGASYFNVANLQTEWTVASKWYDAIVTLSDASNLGHGRFNYNIVAAGVGVDNTKFIKIGGSKVKSKAISVDQINKDITSTSYTFGATDTEKELITATIL